jgi:acyl-CoA synthetase (AMP-forming)/AMP-acid ligase II
MSTTNANVAGRLAERAARHPERDAIVAYRGGRARRVTFGELAARVGRLAAGLQERGVAPGDRVLVFVPMSPALYVTLLACLKAGAAAVFVDAWADRRRLDAAVRAARPKAFVGSPKAHLLRVLSREVRGIPIHLVAGRGRWGLERYESAQPAGPAARVRPDDAALITFTTGSTGAPKAAARSHAFLWAQHEALAAYLRLTEADIDMPTLPIFVLNNLALGVPSVLPEFDPRRPAVINPASIYRQIKAESITTSSGSPAFYERLAGWCAQHGRRLPLRALFTGGAPVLPPLARLLRDTVEGEAHVVYGSTEAEPIAGIEVGAMLRAMGEAKTAAPEPVAGICVGQPVPGIALRLVRPCAGPITLGAAGWRAWEADAGEVVVAGDHVLQGYLDAPAADQENKIRDGERVWHRTGDAGWRDGAGRLCLLGRVGSRVERSGRVWWSLPAEVRALSVPGITHAAYLGVPDAQLGQRAVLCVEVPCSRWQGRPRLSPALRERLLAALAPIPVDELHAFRRIPRDPRHASKTDMEALRRALQRAQEAKG